MKFSTVFKKCLVICAIAAISIFIFNTGVNNYSMILKGMAVDYNNSALDLFHKGQYQEAIIYEEYSLKLDSTNPLYMYNLVQMYALDYPELYRMHGWNHKQIYNNILNLSRTAAIIEPDNQIYVKDYAMNFFSSVCF